MKKILAFLMLALVLSCSEDSGTGPGNGGIPDLGNLRVDIDGTRWNATQGIVFAVVSQSENISVVSVSAARSINTNESEAIAITASTQGNPSNLEKEFSLGVTGQAALAFTRVNTQVSATYISIDGQLVISNIGSNNVSGSFNAICVNSQTLQDTIALTNGSFNAVLTPTP